MLDLFPGHTFKGPAVVEQSDTTTLVEPDMKVRVDALGNLLVGVE
jgi:N-methylhydantoinase A